LKLRINPKINLLIKEKTFLTEFSEEISDMVDNKNIINLQKINEKLLKKYF